MMIVLYSGVSCERPDRATAAMATWTDDVYLLDCRAVSFRLLFDNSSVASIQFPRWLLHGTKPLGMIYSLVLCTPHFFMCQFEHIFLQRCYMAVTCSLSRYRLLLLDVLSCLLRWNVLPSWPRSYASILTESEPSRALLHKEFRPSISAEDLGHGSNGGLVSFLTSIHGSCNE